MAFKASQQMYAYSCLNAKRSSAAAKFQNGTYLKKHASWYRFYHVLASN